MKSKSTIVLFTPAIVFAIGFISIYFLGDYGWTVFVFLPFLIGFLPSYLASKKLELSKKDCYSLSFTSLLISLLVLLICAIEGVICIVMALPILILIIWISAYIGYTINKKKSKLSRAHFTIILTLYSLSFLSFDYINEPEEMMSVKTQIVVNAPIEKVWDNVVSFDTIPEPQEFFFKTGIAYPQNATINGKGVGAIRYCNFTTGSFVEPIITWNEPNLLQFTVASQPLPMKEWNPFWDIYPPHLDGYLKSYKGQFKLERIGNNVTLLEGTTWYKVDIYPQFYWKIWVNTIIHKIHYRVLKHIKSESEKENAQSRNTPKII
ncbi:MAG: hypothetical protein M0D53_14305 [Flavobacterium sp. JAD_PAG50586_2]|nr:MAG: hypothetical protein M0D53_14305 [Flavobacterium sp. JAD_PAG50586_2]